MLTASSEVVPFSCGYEYLVDPVLRDVSVLGSGKADDRNTWQSVDGPIYEVCEMF
jgi:hypothetical protein